MNNKIKYTILGILIISGILTVSAMRNPNDYYVFMGGFNNIESSSTDDNSLVLSYTTYYIPLTLSPTYTLTVIPIQATINVSQPNLINARIQNAIIVAGNDKGYNIKKIIMQNYNIVTP